MTVKKREIKINAILVAAAAAFLLSIWGCGGGGGGGATAKAQTGQARFTINLGAGAARAMGASADKVPSNTEKVVIEVVGTDLPPVEITSLSGSSTVTIINIPIGMQKFEIAAYDATGNVVAHRVESAIIYEGEITSIRASLGMTITSTGVFPSTMTYSIGDRVYIKNDSGALKTVNLFAVVSGTDIRTCGPASGGAINDGGLRSCAIPSQGVNTTILNYLTSNDMTVKVVVDGVHAATITVLQSAAATSYQGSMNYAVNKTEGDAPLTVHFGSVSQGATSTNSFYDFDDPYATSTTATGFNADHTFSQPGNYTVTHTIINGSNTFTDTIHITVSEPPSNPAELPNTGRARFDFNFGTGVDRAMASSAAKIPSNTAKIVIEVEGAGLPPTEITANSSVSTVTIINIPAGMQTFKLNAYDASGNVLASRVESAIINDGETTDVRASLGMTITSTGVIPPAMTYTIGDRFYLKNDSGATKAVNLISVVSGVDTRTCGAANGATLNDGGLLSCAIPSHSVNTSLLSYLSTSNMTVKVMVDGVQAATITVTQSASASSYGGGMNYEVNTTEGEAPLYVHFGSASQGATATNSFYNFDDPYATSTTATGFGADHIFTQPGNYTVTHTIINGAYTYTDTIHITVSEPATATQRPLAAVPVPRASSGVNNDAEFEIQKNIAKRGRLIIDGYLTANNGFFGRKIC